MLRSCLILLFILISGLTVPVLAQETAQKFEVKTELKSAVEPPVEGTAITFAVHISWFGDDDQRIKLIPPSFDTKGLRIDNTAVSTESIPGADGKIKQVRSFVFDMTATKSGEVGIESFPVEYVEQGRSGTQILEVPGRSFRIKAKPLVIPWMLIGITGGALLLTGTITWIIIALIRKRRKEQKEHNPQAEALAKITALDPIFKSGEYPDYIAKLTREFSAYLLDVYHLESTGDAEIEKHPDLSRDEKNTLYKIIEEMTELKYSTEKLDYTDVKEAKRLIEQFIEKKISS